MDLRSLLTRHRARLLSDLPHHWGSQPTGGECHLSLDAHYGPKQKKKNGIVELYMSMVAEVGADHVAAHHQKKYQGELSFKRSSSSKNPKANTEHIVENQQIRKYPDEADLGEKAQK